MERYLAVMAGAALGGAARYALGAAIMHRFAGRFPLGTFVVNVTGCFAIGWLMGWLGDRAMPHPLWRVFLVTGFLGGYTTFSAFGWETYSAWREGDTFTAFWNVAGSVVLGVAAVWLGAMLGGRR